jgi:hypothetical protein
MEFRRRKISDEDAENVALRPENGGYASLSIREERDTLMVKALCSRREIREPSLEHLADDDMAGRIAIDEQPGWSSAELGRPAALKLPSHHRKVEYAQPQVKTILSQLLLEVCGT